jgi:hypothetical protein
MLPCRIDFRLTLEALQVAVMDPYQILGLSRGCTRDDVENAFRIGVWRARPDRGGADDPYIRLSAAYRRILEELDRGSGSGARNPEGVVGGARAWVPPDPDWEPELIVDDRPPPIIRHPRPPDPNWYPELVVRADGLPLGLTPARPDPRVARRDYVSWVRKVGDEAARREPVWESRAGRVIGMVILLGILGGNLWLCWLAWQPTSEATARAAARATRDPARAAARQPEPIRTPPWSR